MSGSKYDILNIEIPRKTIEDWQQMVNLMSEIMNVPAALIMCVHEKTIEVFVKSDNEENVYKEGETCLLDTGLYCETVMDTEKRLLVPNALEDKEWENNPDVELGMISYLGMPVLWPNGKIFGTICVLDSKTNKYSTTKEKLLNQFRNIAQSSLESIYTARQMKNQQDFQQTLLQNSPIPVFYKDIEGKVLDANRAWEKMTGFELKNVLGKTVYDLHEKELAIIYEKEDKKVFNLEENPQVYETKITNRKTQEEFEVVLYKSAYFDEEGEVKGLIATALDITKVSELELKLKDQKKLLVQAKMAALGEMIGNIAHQWRQPLSLIVTTASGVLLHKELGVLTEETLIRSIEGINETALQMSKTIEDFNSFITQNNEEKSKFNIEKQLDKCLDIETGVLEENSIDIIKDIDSTLEITNSAHALMQVVVNIINNAKDVLQANEEEKLLFISAQKNEKEVCITIRDSGGGIKEENMDKIFEPYFTTKHRFHGIGLGLSISYHIVNDIMDGTLSAENETYIYKNKEYKGAKFIITLPL